MYRLLIVDDEKIIVDGLLEMFRNSEFSELDLFYAYSVPEALKIMNQTKIDVVITDITMPGMSGIEFHEQIRHNWPFCKVIYLTGYNQLEYAQSAIRNEGTDFILKTEGVDRILEAFKKAVTSIEKDLKNQAYLERARQQMEIALPLLQKNFLLELANGMECSREEREKQFTELEIQLNCQVGIFLMIGRVDRWPKGMDFTGKMKALYMMQNVVNQHLADLVVLLPVPLEDANILWIIQPKDLLVEGEDYRVQKNVWQRVVSIVHGTMDSLQKTIREIVNIPVSFIVSRYPSSWENLSETFDRMKFSLNKATGVSQEVLLVDGEEANADSDEKTFEMEASVRSQLKQIDKLSKYLDGGQREEFLHTLHHMIENLRGLVDLNDKIFVEVYYSIATVFMSYLYKNRLINQATIQKTIDLERLANTETCQSWDDMEDYFTRLAEFVFDQKADEYMMSTRKIIDKVYNYIEQNLDKELSLNKLAEISRFSPSYLSRLYKQIVGKSISEHIWEAKLQKSKELLLKSDMKINEIAAAVGFNTPSYFTFFFKRNVNMSPQEYRDSKG